MIDLSGRALVITLNEKHFIVFTRIGVDERDRSIRRLQMPAEA